MTNLFRKLKYVQGATTLLIAVMLLFTTTMIIIFAANYGLTQEKITANQTRVQEAFTAAETGLEYAINYLQQNQTAILANPSNGFIQNYTSTSTTNVTLGNGTRFSIVYSNPVANNYQLIQIVSTGTSIDGSTTRSVRQLVQFGSLLLNPGTSALTSKGAVNLSGNGTITNTATNQTINSALSVTLGGSSQTQTSSGGSSPGNIGSDIVQNNSTLANTSQNDFFAGFFGNASTATIKSQMANYYSNSSNTNYSGTLTGKTGTTIWIDQASGTTASLTGTTSIGSASAPVLMVINGSFSMSGTVDFYGFIFVIGTSGITALTGNINIVGGIASTDTLNMTGTSSLTYDPNVLSNLQNLPALRYYAKVPGSWRDF